jgi:outer membrane protein
LKFYPFFIFILITAFLKAVEPLSLSDLIDTGLQNHPKTKQAWWNAKRAESILGTAKSAYYPDIVLNTRGVHGRNFKFINGPDTNYTIIRADLALSMMLYDFGRTDADVQTAKMSLIAAGWEYDFTMQKVIVDILENAYRVANAEESFAASQLSLRDAHQMVNTSEKLFDAGLNPISDVYISKSALSLMQIDAAKRKSLLEIQKGRLAASLNLPIESEFALAKIPIPIHEERPHLDELLLLAENQRGDLMRKRAETAAAASNLTRAHAEYKPRLYLGGRGGYEKAVKDNADGAHYEVVLNFEVPLFNGFKTFYQTRSAYAALRGMEEETAELELNIAMDVLRFSKSLEATEKMFFYAEENLHNAQKAYQGTLDKYRIGEESIAELTAAQKQLAQARILHSDIKTEFLVSIANLSFATGTLDTCKESPCLE